MRFQNPKLLGEVILFILYEKVISEGGELRIDYIQARLPTKKISSTLIEYAIDEIKNRNFIKYSTVNGFSAITLNRIGYDYVRHRISKIGTAVNSYSKSPEWLLDDELQDDDAQIVEKEDASSSIPIDGKINEVDQPIPASDRIVSRNDNAEAFEEASSTLDQVLKEFKEDHKLDNEFGQEKGALIKALEAGKELLTDSQAHVDALNALIVKPLQIIKDRYEKFIEKYEQAVVGVLMSEAIPAALKAIDFLIGLAV